MRHVTSHTRYILRSKPYVLHDPLRVVIFGYFGCENLGDETNLAELVFFLRKIRPGIGITVISAAPGATAQKLGVESVGKYDWPGIAGVFRKADLLIGGGGSLFQDRSSLRSLGYYVGLIFAARRSGLDMVLYGQGIGPVHSGIGKHLARWALSQVQTITVRDRLSQLALEGLAVTGPRVHLTAEPLLLKDPVPESAVKSYWEEIPTGSGSKLGLIPLEFQWLNASFWCQLLDALRRDNLQLFLISTTKEEWRLNQGLSKKLGIPILPVRNCWETLQTAIGGLNLLVSARLHGLVAAVAQGTPCYGLAADPKIEGFCIPLRIAYCPLAPDTHPLLLSNRILNGLKQAAASAKSRQSAPGFMKSRALRNQTILKQVIMGRQPRGES
jgi:polysaccharide pyruvyl transferase CsaB